MKRELINLGRNKKLVINQLDKRSGVMFLNHTDEVCIMNTNLSDSSKCESLDKHEDTCAGIEKRKSNDMREPLTKGSVNRTKEKDISFSNSTTPGLFGQPKTLISSMNYSPYHKLANIIERVRKHIGIHTV